MKDLFYAEGVNDIAEIKMILNGMDGRAKRINAEYSPDDYEVLRRVWVRSDGKYIREWSPKEYINLNPKEKIIERVRVNGDYIDIEAHCVELRRMYARNKNGERVFTFVRSFDYSEAI